MKIEIEFRFASVSDSKKTCSNDIEIHVKSGEKNNSCSFCNCCLFDRK